MKIKNEIDFNSRSASSNKNQNNNAKKFKFYKLNRIKRIQIKNNNDLVGLNINVQNCSPEQKNFDYFQKKNTHEFSDKNISPINKKFKFTKLDKINNNFKNEKFFAKSRHLSVSKNQLNGNISQNNLKIVYKNINFFNNTNTLKSNKLKIKIGKEYFSDDKIEMNNIINNIINTNLIKSFKHLKTIHDNNNCKSIQHLPLTKIKYSAERLNTCENNKKFNFYQNYKFNVNESEKIFRKFNCKTKQINASSTEISNIHNNYSSYFTRNKFKKINKKFLYFNTSKEQNNYFKESHQMNKKIIPDDNSGTYTAIYIKDNLNNILLNNINESK